MAMDDPWGSPWADETQTPLPVKLNGDDFAVKPTTPVKGTSLALEQKTNSPWDDADDDGFGDWAVGNPEKEQGLGFDGAYDGWTRNDGDERGYDPKLEGSHALSGSWENDATISDDPTPKLGPGLPPKPSDILRQPSPDPWVVDINQEDGAADTVPVTSDRHDKGSIDVKSMPELSRDDDITQDKAPVVVEDGVLPGTIGIKDGPTRTNSANGIVEGSDKWNHESEETLKPIEIIAQNGDIQAVQEGLSRRSSSPSEHSHHDETTEDSPRTSLDEEPKRPSVARKVSSKIQELVEHFDGLAKQEEVAVPIVGRIGSPKRKTDGMGNVEEEKEEEEEMEEKEEMEEEAVEEEMDDFGDFEDVQSETEGPMDEEKANSPPKSPIAEDSKINAPEPETTHDAPQARIVTKDLGPVEFTVDPTVLDRIYSEVEAKPPPENVYIPDVVPHDSFSSTEERKLWYRISRYGTMRKYNTGDDENYVRVNWTQSQVRTETLKIVARWIEEDRISGRVVLGGASKGSSIFGWNDSKVAPVPLATVFAVNSGKGKVVPTAIEPAVEIPREWPKGLVRTRSTSTSPSLSKARRKSSTKSITTEDAKSQLPVASFGWNAVPPSVQDSNPQSPVHMKTLSASSSSTPLAASKVASAALSTATRVSSPLAEPTKRAIPVNGIPPRPHSIAHTNMSPPPPLKNSKITTNDDDWGELVSSPTTNITPDIPSPSSLLHKATGSIDSVFPRTAPIPELMSANSQPLPPGQKGDGFSNLNESPSAQTTNSITMNTTNSLNQNGFTASSYDLMDAASGPTAQTTRQSVAAASVDPWESADFSFFESSTASVSQPTRAPVPKAIPKSVTFSPPAMASMPPRNQQSRDEIEQDRIVQNIIQGLPDLSYMLRK
jgi:hypothetical protein